MLSVEACVTLYLFSHMETFSVINLIEFPRNATAIAKKVRHARNFELIHTRTEILYSPLFRVVLLNICDCSL